MSNDNYPAGVTDAHPYFNPPAISASAVECGADEALVVPAHYIRARLEGIIARLEDQAVSGWAVSNRDANAILADLQVTLNQVAELQQEREYECPFKDDMDLEESECARWDCPVCGSERETDTLPEERDPDEEWERRNER